jgi:alanyl-tRNA synthetase
LASNSPLAMPAPRSAAALRQDFLDFFRERGHEIVPSAPLVPRGDATLLFTNAGMNQFKDVFLGSGSRPYVRAADTQKCLRVSGKHNDLEEVGYDTYHHTFFEMLGNWSFGDYFKAEAIAWAWELLVDRWGLVPDRLYATVHEGDATLGLAPDDEAARLWREKTTIPHDHILTGSSKDNFWMMGDTGPCGPCSELHVDLRPDDERAATPGHLLVNQDDPRVIEIWNLVFIQFNAQPDGSLKPLAARHVDTGMGFERICAVVSGTHSTYDTDLFAGLLHKTASLSPRSEVAGYNDIRLGDPSEVERVRVALRVVADHVRTLGFAIADGAAPGNTGRGYVIRRILRRAVRYGYQTLEIKEPFLHQLIPVLVDTMGEAFPELAAQADYISRVVEAEERGFLETLGTGLSSFEALVPHLERFAAASEMPSDEALADAQAALKADQSARDLLTKAFAGETWMAVTAHFSQAASDRELPGEVAFLLHDTYGFPLDLTALLAREQGFGVGMAAFDARMGEQKARARAAGTFSVDQSRVDAWEEVGDEGASRFVGYDALEAQARVVAWRTVGGAAEGERRHELVLDATPFYAESGGQVGDQGTLVVGDQALSVLDTQRQNDRIVHVVDCLPDELDAPVRAHVDAGRRAATQRHHTATHLLHAGLRALLGEHVQQKGSLVAPDRLRFDFSHYERVGPDVLRELEAWVNGFIQDNVPLQDERDVPIDDALARGATALFGEKYGEHVRVVTFDPARSMELCGGTHARATGELGVFRIVGEGSVASGVRRIEAVAGPAALASIWNDLAELERARGRLKTLGRSVDEEIEVLQDQARDLQRELDASRKAALSGRVDELAASAERVGSVRLATARIDGLEGDSLRDLAQQVAQHIGSNGVAVVGSTGAGEGKVMLACAAEPDALGAGVHAGKLVGVLARHVGGGGGGRPNLATAGGKNPDGLDAALQAARSALESQVG